jgi:hypothetical protein
MMFSIIYFLKRRCNISAFSTEFLLWVVLSAQLQGGNSQGNRIKDANGFLTAVSGSTDLMRAQSQARFAFPVHSLHSPALLVDTRHWGGVSSARLITRTFVWFGPMLRPFCSAPQ